jgi:hypothetical protein
VVHLLVDVVVLVGVNICESTTGEYIKYSASPNKRWGDVDGEGGSIIQKKRGFGPWGSITLPASFRVMIIIN